MTPDAFLAEHPLTAAVDLLLPDLNGVLRGKRLPFGALEGALRGELHFPTGLYGLDTTGTNAEGAFDLTEAGADRPVALDAGTLRPVPWRAGRAQILGGLLDHDGATPFFADPRALLRRVAARFDEIRLTPVVAVELEFHLLDTDEAGRPRPPEGEIDAFLPERLDGEDRFLALVEEYAEAQELTLKGALAEYAPGQFEVNLAHGPDPVRAADNAVLLKRLVRAAASTTGRCATFMAKPFEGRSGNGLHVHLSLTDRDGRNLFGETGPGGEAALRHAVAGLLALMPESAMPFLPNANSYRRLLPDSFAPTAATWGVNNRTVAVRIPPGPAASRRLEHRLAGADASPYLALAAVLAGVHHGLANRLDPGPPLTGDAYAQEGAPALPSSWDAAITALQRGETLKIYFGESLCHLYAACREAERTRFEAKVTPTEHAWYLGV